MKGTPDWAGDFIAAICDGLHATDAADRAGVARGTVYIRRRDDEEFRKAWNEAAILGTEMLESEANRRAYYGWLEPIFYKGDQAGAVRKYSDAVLMFLLRSRDPNKYRDNMKTEIVGKDDSQLPSGVVLYLPDNGRSRPDADDEPAESAIGGTVVADTGAAEAKGNAADPQQQ